MPQKSGYPGTTDRNSGTAAKDTPRSSEKIKSFGEARGGIKADIQFSKSTLGRVGKT